MTMMRAVPCVLALVLAGCGGSSAPGYQNAKRLGEAYKGKINASPDAILNDIRVDSVICVRQDKTQFVCNIKWAPDADYPAGRSDTSLVTVASDGSSYVARGTD